MKAFFFTILCLLAVVSIPQNASSRPVIAYVTDLEGSYERLLSFIRHSNERVVFLDAEGQLQFKSGDFYFVFGGDAVDRGAYSQKLVRLLLDFKRRHPSRVVLILGNRDINKMRLISELSVGSRLNIPTQMWPWIHQHGYTPGTASLASIRLRWILEKSMGAPDAFNFRFAELRRARTQVSDQMVAESYLNELGEGGDFREFLLHGQLAALIDGNLFTHGSLTDESFGFIPGRSEIIEDVRIWVSEINKWGHEQILEWAERRPRKDDRPPGQDLIDFQQPAPGTRANRKSIVYGRSSDATGNPFISSLALVEKLKHQSIRRKLEGHTDYGFLPLVLRADDFDFIFADSSDRLDLQSPGLIIENDDVHIVALTHDGELLKYSLGASPLIGLRTKEGYLVKAVTQDRQAILFRNQKPCGKFLWEEIRKPLSEIALSELHSPCGAFLSSITR